MINIAIDGPAGAGKSSVAKAVSKKLGYKYIDTGAMYRTIAFYILENNIDYNLNKDFLNKIKIDLKFINDEQHLFLNNTDITNKIRTEEISMLTSKISSKVVKPTTPPYSSNRMAIWFCVFCICDTPF